MSSFLLNIDFYTICKFLVIESILSRHSSLPFRFQAIVTCSFGINPKKCCFDALDFIVNLITRLTVDKTRYERG